eukprot:TRINITY_DN2381_c0_g1_i1.p1 TRINITY_DN2381_c0_g1~~TRINITY_DN2381_c0_g1_i1.p1  ORF type:complete len:641 (+),score=164.36 TRINITY_DN2381_c0_g1_i1:213-2135(+)
MTRHTSSCHRAICPHSSRDHTRMVVFTTAVLLTSVVLLPMDPNAKTNLEIFVSVEKLPAKDVLSKSDPFCVMDLLDMKSQSWNRVGVSELIKDCLNPEFTKEFVVTYYFEEQQKLRLTFYDADTDLVDEKQSALLGKSEFVLADLVAASGMTLHLPLMNDKGKCVKKNCVVTVRGEEIAKAKVVPASPVVMVESTNSPAPPVTEPSPKEEKVLESLTLKFVGEKLDKKDFFGKSDPYLEFFRLREDGGWTNVHRTEVIKNTLNPTWKEFTVSLQSLCNSDLQRPILIKCWDWDKGGSSDLIGNCQTSAEVLMASSSMRMQLINPDLEKKKGYKGSGTLILIDRQVNHSVHHVVEEKKTLPIVSRAVDEKTNQRLPIQYAHSFLDYIKGGCTLNIMVAIDFTGSNGDPCIPSSLHYLRGSSPNQYQTAIEVIGNIVAPYDSDNLIPVFGFGGQINSNTSHCFALNFQDNPEVKGVQGILAAYNNSFSKVSLSGPTNFASIIKHASHLAKSPQTTQSEQHYNILLMITDGEICDMTETQREIQQATSSPLSIIIVGVGNADFSNMKILDGDDSELFTRDIVQFVPFNKLGNQHISMLAKETLAEVPDQMLAFMHSRNIVPNAPREAAPRPEEFENLETETHL